MPGEERELEVLHANASDEAKDVLKRVMELENRHLYENQPRVVRDVVNIIKEVVK